MKKKLALALILALSIALLALPGGVAFADGDNTLTVYAWDANFNIPALEAAEAAFQNVNPDFKLEIIQQSASSDVEQAVTLAASSGDLSTLPDIVLFQDHYIQNFVTSYPDAWQSLEALTLTGTTSALKS